MHESINKLTTHMYVYIYICIYIYIYVVFRLTGQSQPGSKDHVFRGLGSGVWGLGYRVVGLRAETPETPQPEIFKFLSPKLYN